MKKLKKNLLEITDIHLDDETQARLNALAKVLGRTPEGLCVAMLERQILHGPYRGKYLEIKTGYE